MKHAQNAVAIPRLGQQSGMVINRVENPIRFSAELTNAFQHPLIPIAREKKNVGPGFV